MSSPELPGLDVSSRVRARDIQLTGVADVGRRVLMITGAIDTTDHDVSVSVSLPEPGRWQVIKAETNLTDRTWVAMQAVMDEDSTFLDDQMLMSPQFAKSFMTPDQRRLTFYDGEVRPGETVLKTYSMETTGRKPTYFYSRYSPIATDSAEQSQQTLGELVANGLGPRPGIALIVPGTEVCAARRARVGRRCGGAPRGVVARGARGRPVRGCVREPHLLASPRGRHWARVRDAG